LADTQLSVVVMETQFGCQGCPPKIYTMSKTYVQIQKQIEQLQKEAEALRKSEASGVLLRIKEAIAVYGFTAEELGVASRGKASSTAVSTTSRASSRRKAGAPKFRDGQGNEWGGRGPRPAWFKSALASGKTPQELAA
jgi:DNA-binding protein H-NS